jgi:hypothetical protein
MDWEKIYYIRERWRVKCNYNIDNYFKCELIIKCEVLGFDKKIHGTCFGHVFSNAWQYDTTDEKTLQKPLIYLYQVCVVKFVKMYHLA